MANIGLLVTCPLCGADRGAHCAASGKRRPPSWWSHQERVNLARTPEAQKAASVIVQEESNAIIAELLRSPYACCEIGFADMAAHDRHVAGDHATPTALGLIWTREGWSSR